MLISHFTTLQNKELSQFVSFRKAESDKTDESKVDLHYLFFLLDSLVILNECKMSAIMCHLRFSSHKKGRSNKVAVTQQIY